MESLNQRLLSPCSARDYISLNLKDFFKSVQKDKSLFNSLSFLYARANDILPVNSNFIFRQEGDNFSLTNFHDIIDLTDDVVPAINLFLASKNASDRKLVFRMDPAAQISAEVENYLASAIITPITQVTGYVDLSENLDLYLAGLKPKLRRRIQQSYDNFQFNVPSDPDNFLSQYSRLHGRLSGGVISDTSWNLLLDSLRNQHSIAIQVLRSGNFVGGAIFSLGKFTAHYSNGAYDRDLFPLPITHGLLIEAFKIMKNLGCKIIVLDDWYSDLVEDEKKLAIRRFKSPFCNELFEREVYRVVISGGGKTETSN